MILEQETTIPLQACIDNNPPASGSGQGGSTGGTGGGTGNGSGGGNP